VNVDPKSTSLSTPTILVTGASSGIGLACVRLLAKQGFSIVGVSRRVPDLDSALGPQPRDLIQHLRADLTKEFDLQSVVQFFLDSRDEHSLVGLVNCAGVGSSGAVGTMDMASLRRLFEINFFSTVSLTSQLVPLLAANSGRIVNIGSTSGRIPRPLAGAYGASKAALESFTRTLRMELRGSGMHVVMIEPGVVDTPFWESMRHSRHASTVDPSVREQLNRTNVSPLTASTPQGLAPEAVAKIVLEAFTRKRPRSRYIVGADAQRALLLDHISPNWVSDWLRGSATSK
jgi:NAD(P)-dependent dehydrogenase (short-subunit alcohol dehydrogenase family)